MNARYSFDGSPVFYNTAVNIISPDGPRIMSTSDFKPPLCNYCKKTRVFEFQLMPQLLALVPSKKTLAKKKQLEKSDINIDGMDWGTILIYVCSSDCVPNMWGEAERAEWQTKVTGKVGFVEECVIMQTE